MSSVTDLPYRSEPKATNAAHGHDAHAHVHLTPWPIITGFSAALFAMGIATWGVAPYLLVVGFLLTALGVVGWIREDYLAFPKGPNPLTQHTQGVKDNGWWGIMLFLTTEVILFASIFGIWFSAKAMQPQWPPAGTPGEGLPIVPTGINTAVLVASGFVMAWGEKGIMTGNRRRFVIGYIGAIVLGAVFLAFQVKEYIDLVHEGFVLSSNIYTTTFYMLTGTHGFHVLGGLIFLTIVLVRGAKGQFDGKRHVAVTAAAYYWHFVDIVWLLLYAVVYLEVI